MILFPAVDIRGGKAVRLNKGRADAETIFSNDPVAMAKQWEEQGAQYLHVIDLDGAFDGISPNTGIISEICRSVSIPVQLGGGIRSEGTAQRWLDAGITRLIIGTMALEHPNMYEKLCRCCPEGSIGVSLDAEKGRLKTRGWVTDTQYTIDAILPRLESCGTSFLIYTDIERDGTKAGINLEALSDLAKKSSIPVIAAGGVATLEDIRRLHPLSVHANLQGAITGQAIYEGTLSVAEAVAWIRQADLQSEQIR
ncbi:MAG: 1-(5-phosphoribosyl)-5-[(5-phosphoribosylamino)methylideneamino]imidazole-4-carboxamide isomerase [Desulfovibrionaceae bacterium]|nr:1-(5-phosphoribosyl)-5-[(5-phosphoribosylamino)methylideneamino]imidazole-4-carboxamide isomerase [Desulfovibrionaceae bacterium]